MLNRIVGLLSPFRAASGERTVNAAQWVGLALTAVAFVLIATLIIGFDSLVPGRNNIASLQVGDISPADIRAPFDWRYESKVLTERRQQAAMDATAAKYDPPDPNVARQQVQFARQILDYIDNVRRDPFGTIDQKVRDINQITALTLSDDTVRYIIGLSDDSWKAIDSEVINDLERVMREEIRESNLTVVKAQLPMQVSVRFADKDVVAIVAIIEDLLRPNTFPNPAATEAARQAAANAIPAETRVFERGQIVVREGARIETVDYEALSQLGLLQTADRRLQEVGRSLLASLLVVIVFGMYLSRFKPSLFGDVRFLILIGALFLIDLLGARLFGDGTEVYIYPTAALALLLVALTGPEVAVIGVLGLSLLVGLMDNRSLEIATLIATGGLMGALTLRRAERLNSFFLAGLVVALVNILVISLFNLEMLSVEEGTNLGLLMIYGLVNGIFSAAIALAAMYVVTLLFNLPTSLKLVELSQPNQPLLQRLLREAPGTYQHSLQVANLSEQAANAVGASAELVRVAALYHDIGKMLNPAFFVENQADAVNPHDVLNDPVRSADIIISHVTDGDRLARQFRLPARIRDFIIEHHGTTTVSYFYREALAQADDKESVDVDQFTYPGPRPQSKETAILMLADSSESTVRARKPTNKQEIAEIIQQIIDARMRDGQLDDSNLTTNDIKSIRNIFVEMLQAVFHPRINYPSMPPILGSAANNFTQETVPVEPAASEAITTTIHGVRVENGDSETRPATATVEIPAVDLLSDDDAPLPEVPPLRRSTQIVRVVGNGDVEPVTNGNGVHEERVEDKVESE